MGCVPHLDADINRRLKLINSHFYAQWDIKRDRWKIMAKIAGHNPQFVTMVRGDRKEYIPIDERTYSRLRKIIWYNRKLKEYVYDLMYAEERMNNAKDGKEHEHYKQVAKEMRRPVQMLSRQLGITSGKAKLPYSPGFGQGTLNVCAN